MAGNTWVAYKRLPWDICKVQIQTRLYRFDASYPSHGQSSGVTGQGSRLPSGALQARLWDRPMRCLFVKPNPVKSVLRQDSSTKFGVLHIFLLSESPSGDIHRVSWRAMAEFRKFKVDLDSNSLVTSKKTVGDPIGFDLSFARDQVRFVTLSPCKIPNLPQGSLHRSAQSPLPPDPSRSRSFPALHRGAPTSQTARRPSSAWRKALLRMLQ